MRWPNGSACQGDSGRADLQGSNSSGSDWSNTKSCTGTPPLVGLGVGGIEGGSLIQEVADHAFSAVPWRARGRDGRVCVREL